MPNTRIVNCNLTDFSTLTCSNTHSLSHVDWLKTNKKSEILQTNGTSTQITLTTAAAETVGLVALPICNLTPAATVRVRLYSDTGGSSLLHDTGTVNAVAPNAKTYATWKPAPDGVAGFAYGSGKYAIVWIDPQITGVRHVKVDVSDSGNAMGHLEFARMCVGEYFEVDYTPDYGAGITPIFMTQNSRNDAGDNMSNRAPQSRKINFDLKSVSDTQRRFIIDAIFKNDLLFPVFVGLIPGDLDQTYDHQLSIYGKVSASSKITFANFAFDMASIEIEEI